MCGGIVCSDRLSPCHLAHTHGGAEGGGGGVSSARVQLPGPSWHCQAASYSRWVRLGDWPWPPVTLAVAPSRMNPSASRR